MLIALLAGAAAVVCHVWTRRFVSRRLRFTPIVQKRRVAMAVTLIAGVGVTVLANTLFLLVPAVGLGSALALGAGTGTGVWFGRKTAKHRRLLEE